MIQLLRHQRALWEATERLVAMVAGYGAGKTYTALLKMVQLAQENPGLNGAYVAPTYPMCKDLGFRDFLSLAERLGFRTRTNKAELNIEIWCGPPGREAWSRILFRSGDKPDSLKGLNLAWALVDEAGMMHEDVWKQLLARVRVESPDGRSQLVVIGTPEGGPGTWFGQIAEFGPPGVRADRLIRARTADNPHLPPTYLEDMRSRYTPEEFRGYCEGYFVASGGSVYRWNADAMLRDFDPSDHAGEVQIWADFNVGKVVWLLAHVNNGVVHVFDEIVSQNTYTNEQATKAVERLRQWGLDPSGVKVYHDANTSRKSASATRDGSGLSDVKELRLKGFKSVPAGRQNPPVRDRVAAVNRKLQGGTLFVAPRCKELTTSLATQGRDKAGNPDKSGGLDHAVDALGYGIFRQWPYQHKPDEPERGPNRYH